jgi:serine phosphatase RsbU (regulator of sigma subunit)
MEENRQSGKRYDRFAIFSTLFVFVPCLFAWVLGSSYLSLADENLRKETSQELVSRLHQVLTQTDPEVFLTARFQRFSQILFRRRPGKPALIRLYRKAIAQWKCPFDLYFFDEAGKLSNLSPLSFPFQKPIQALWYSIFWEFSAKKERSLFQKPLWNIFGIEFIKKTFPVNRGRVLRFSFKGKSGYCFYEFDPCSLFGGVILIAWEMPERTSLIKALAGKERFRDITFLVQGKQGIQTVFGPDSVLASATFLENRPLAASSTIRPHGFLWSGLPFDDCKLYAGRPLPETKQERGGTLFALVLLSLFGFGVWFFHRWIVQGLDFPLSLRYKLTSLFLYTFIISFIGVSSLAFKLLNDRQAVLASECQKRGQEALNTIDQDFLKEKERLLQFFKTLKPEADEYLSAPDRYEEKISLLKNQGLLTIFRLLDIHGNELFSTARPGQITSGGKRVLDSMAHESMNQYLSNRPGYVPLHEKSVGGGVISEFLDSVDESMTSLKEGPDRIHTIKLSNLEDYYYWSYFLDPKHPAGFISIAANISMVMEKYLQAHLLDRQEYLGTSFRLFAIREDSRKWFPPEAYRLSGLREFAYKVRLNEGFYADTISFKGQDYWAFGLRGKNLQGYYLLAVFPRYVMEKQIRQLRSGIGWGLLLLLLISLLTGYVVADTFLNPIGELGAGIRAIQDGETTFRIQSKEKDEFGAVAQAFNGLMEHLDEMNAGKLVQQELLPRKMLEVGEYRMVGFCRPATDLGGDYFDYLPIDANRFLVVTGDVTGHGIPAALVMAIAKGIVTRYARFPETLENLLRSLNQVFLEGVKRKKFMTLIALSMDAANHSGTIINCGQCYPILWSKAGESDFLELKGAMMGVSAKLKLFPQEIRLAPGDRLLFYTDGLVESFPATDRDGFSLFKDFVLSRPRLPIEEACLDILDNHPFSLTGKPRPDDFTIVMLERKSS